MKFTKYLLAFAALAGLSFSGVILAADHDGHTEFEEELNERDFDALREFLKSRKVAEASVAEKTSNFLMNGDVRTEWRHMTETCRGKRYRGPGAEVFGRPSSNNDFDIEFNLYLNYVFNNYTWAVAQVRYDNSAGVDDNGHPCEYKKDDKRRSCDCAEQAEQCIGDPCGFHGSGSCDDLCLKKAYMGISVYKCGCQRVDIELGRRGNLYNVFDSNVQFLSRLDGILVKYDCSWDEIADFYVHTAGFVVDEKVNHFAWVTEVGFMDIADLDIDFKYSFIDWEKRGKNRCFCRNPAGFRFKNSQFLLAYHLNPELLGKPTKFYGAFLVNHAAEDIMRIIRIEKDPNVPEKKIIITKNYGRQNLAWYAGILFGKVVKEGDWALEVQYQYVEAQAMPDDDTSGIGRGNVLDESFTSCSRRGNTNYKGWRLEGLYALTDNMTLDSIIEWSKAADDKVGGPHTYSKFELEAIYAF